VLRASALLLAVAPPAGARSRDAVPPPANARAADSLLASAASRPAARRALEAWAREATLHELVYLLRRPDAELAGLAPVLARRALEGAPAARADLGLRLALRLHAAKPADPFARRLLAGRDAGLQLPARPLASIYRVGAVLPTGGDYELHGRSVREGVAVALAEFEERFGVGVDLVACDSRGDQPAAASRAADTLSRTCGVLVGELLSPSTFAAASLAAGVGLPLVSPTAPDEEVGDVGPGIFQVGPSGYQRGQFLARAVLAQGVARLALLWSSPTDENSFVQGFRAAAESAGAQIVWENRYPAGTEDFRASIRALKRRDPQALLWEGEPREGERLVRQLAQEKASLVLCGGESLDPELVHPEVRALLEGVLYVADDWKLTPDREATLAAGLAALGSGPLNRLHARGYLAGLAIGAALAQGALCPEEVQHLLAQRLAPEPFLAARGFLRWAPEDAGLMVLRVERGHAVPAEAPAAAR
jgi:ABC-type branched-subunit amino acid transport system substrate-binding protein